LTTSFPFGKNDISGKFIKDQILNLKRYYPNIKFTVLTGNKNKFEKNEDNISYDLKIFRYFFKSMEILGNEAIKIQINKNKLILFLIPFYFISQLINASKVSSKNGINLIYVHWFFPQALTAYLIYKFKKIPYKITIHSSEIEYFLKFFKSIGLGLAKKIILNSSGVSTTSKEVFESLKLVLSDEELLQVNTVISPMGINSDLLEETIALEVKGVEKENTIKNILFIGRLVEKKGILELIENFSSFYQINQSYNLIIAGYGALENEIKNYILKNEFGDFIKFLGKVNDEQKKYLFDNSEILVVPSIKTKDDTEGMPVVIVEGLYYGIILLVSQYTNPYSVITHKENGFIFDIDKDNELLNYLIHISELDNIEKSKVKKQAKISSSKYSSQESSKLYFDFLSFENNENI
tara:strand:+ start:4608 stop:5831 length:1224 start_codon:yes stop_codon:yes gene_type:complete